MNEEVRRTVLTPTHPVLPGHIPFLRRGFYISGPLAVFFIVATILGGIYLCRILVYVLVNHFSTRWSSPCVKGGPRVGGSDSGGKDRARGGREKPGTGSSGSLWGRHISLEDQE